ncbi:MAG: hypothetical protein JO247_02670 [Chloroflexi bacterium]|nr:hypothetical protein [Chloroflexota bacterium]
MERLAVPIVVAIGVALILWYLAGNWLMRRRAGLLAVWCKRAADQFGRRQTIKWFTINSFKIEVEEPSPGLRALSFTGLTEAWDVPFIWLWNRMHWRRDMVLAQLTMRKQPLWGFELFRAGSVLSGDARRAADHEGWPEGTFEGFQLAPADGPGRELAERLLTELSDQRAQLVRLSVRRNDVHVSLGLNVPSPDGLPPEKFAALLRELASAASASPALSS